MENKKMSCWDFVFSSVKTHIDDLVRQADKYTKDMNEDFEHFFCGMPRICTRRNVNFPVTVP